MYNVGAISEKKSAHTGEGTMMLICFDPGFDDVAVDGALEKATVEIKSWTRQAAVRIDGYFSNHRTCPELSRLYRNANIQ